MIHSGSRNLGKTICDNYIDKAKELNAMYYSSVDESIAFLPVQSLVGREYLNSMGFALTFARLNRFLMMDCVKKDMAHLFAGRDIVYGDIINIHHNYASLENHFGRNVWVHRKGATSAKRKQEGIIPGSMGRESYIVEGLGNRDSFSSCSHGAGRVCSRTQFNKDHNSVEKLQEIEEKLEGVTHSKFSKITRNKKMKGLLDVSESPDAYKDISVVMENQTDLVRITEKLHPFINCKG